MQIYDNYSTKQDKDTTTTHRIYVAINDKKSDL